MNFYKLIENIRSVTSIHSFWMCQSLTAWSELLPRRLLLRSHLNNESTRFTWHALLACLANWSLGSLQLLRAWLVSMSSSRWSRHKLICERVSHFLNGLRNAPAVSNTRTCSSESSLSHRYAPYCMKFSPRYCPQSLDPLLSALSLNPLSRTSFTKCLLSNWIAFTPDSLMISIDFLVVVVFR